MYNDFSSKRSKKINGLTREQFHNYADIDLEDHPSKELNGLMERNSHLYGIDGKSIVRISTYCACMPYQ